MPYYLGKNYSKKEFLSYVGDPAQIVRAVPSTLSNGKASGIQSISINNGSGLDFSVLPGRGFDIPFCTYKGIPINFFSGTGITSPGYYEEPGFGWLRSAFFGLLTTCGIVSSGFPDNHEGTEYGLHGRISNTAAEDVSIFQDWVDDDYIIRVSGKLREVAAFGEQMILKRSIETKLGSNKFIINDCIENQGFSAQPLMMLYHFNFGFPLLSPDSRIIGPIKGKIARDEISEKDNGLENSLLFQPPEPDFQEKVFFYSMGSKPNGDTFVALVNKNIENEKALAIIMRYNINELPRFTHWKMPSQGFYVTGLEPGTVGPLGRGKEINAGNVPFLEGQESHNITIELEITDSLEDIKQLEKDAESLS